MPTNHIPNVIEVRRTEEFIGWAHDLCGEDAKAKIALRLRRLAMGNPGDVKTLGGGLSELRIDHGPDYPCISPGAATR